MKRLTVVLITLLYLLNLATPAFAAGALGKPKNLKATSVSYNSVKLAWSKVSGAKGYSVYRSLGGKYKLITSTSKLEYINKGLTTGKTYSFKVRGFAGKKKGQYSKVVKAKPVPAAPVVKAKASAENITLSWNGVKGANGYVVYKASKQSGPFAVLTEAKGKGIEDAGLTAGLTNYYKVRAFRNVGKTRVYGGFSAVAFATAPVAMIGVGYVYNPELNVDLNVRSGPDTKSDIIGHLFNYQKIEILETIKAGNVQWDKIVFENQFAYVSDSYIQRYATPPENVVSVAVGITKELEVGNGPQIAGSFDGQGLSLGYLQWNIGQGTLQPLLHRMDRQYNAEMKKVFGKNYDTIHSVLLDTAESQLAWAKGLNDSNNKIIEPWNSQLVTLTKNKHFIEIEGDAEVYTVKKAMAICELYGLKTVRGFALAFDIVNQNGSISTAAAETIDAALQQNPEITEKELLSVIADAVTGASEDVKARKRLIVEGKGRVHGSSYDLDKDFGLNDNVWR